MGGDGGAILFAADSSSRPSKLNNVTVYGNVASGKGGGVFGAILTPEISNSIFWDNLAGGASALTSKQQLDSDWSFQIIHSCIQGFPDTVDSSGNFGVDPLFVDVDGPDGVPGNEDDQFSLTVGSPCLNAGDNTFVFDLSSSDLAGLPRIHAGVVDIGAFENQESPEPVVIEAISSYSEANQVRLVVRFSEVAPQTRALVYRNATPDLAGRTYLWETTLAATSDSLEVIDPSTPFLESRWYTIDFVGADRGLVRAGPVSGMAQEGTVRVLPPAPNPFTSETRFQLVVPADPQGKGTVVGITVYDIQGAAVRTLLHALLDPGPHEVAWDGRNDRGQSISRGIYYLRVSVGTARRSFPIVRLN
jgi:hypothetical protein